MKKLVVTLDYLGPNDKMVTTEVSITNAPQDVSNVIHSVLKLEKQGKTIPPDKSFAASYWIRDAVLQAKRLCKLDVDDTCLWKIEVKN